MGGHCRAPPASPRRAREPGGCHLDPATSSRPPPYSFSQGQGHYRDNNNTSIANILISRPPYYDAGTHLLRFRSDPPPGGCHRKMTRFPLPRATPCLCARLQLGQMGCGPPLGPAVAFPWKEPWSRHAPWLQDPVSCTSWQQPQTPVTGQPHLGPGGHGGLQRTYFLHFSSSVSLPRSRTSMHQCSSCSLCGRRRVSVSVFCQHWHAPLNVGGRSCVPMRACVY